MELDQIRRKITALENKQRVSVANTAVEAKGLRNEGSVLKASSGVITSNVVIKAPNIPDDLQQKVKSIDELNKKVETNTTNIAANTTAISGKADSGHTHNDLSTGISTNASAISSLNNALSTLETSVKNLNIPDVSSILDAIKDIQYIMTSSLTSFASMKHIHEVQDELVTKIEELTTLVNTISTNDSSQDKKITALETTVKNKADSTHTHTLFENALTINDKSQTTSYPLSVFNDSINENQSMVIGLGKARDIYQCAKIEYYYSTTDPYLQLSLYSGGGKIRIYKNRMEFNSLITSQNTITAWDVRTKDNISLYDTYTKVNSLSTSFTEVETTATSAYEKVTDMEGSISSLEQDYTTVSSTLTEIKSKVDTLDSTLTNVESTTESVKQKVTDMEGNITTLEQYVDSIQDTILQTLYPVGSIYTSMNNTDPNDVLGFGTWKQIVDRFMYCTSSSKITGGSKIISTDNLPAHTHELNGWAWKWGNTDNVETQIYCPSSAVSGANTGNYINTDTTYMGATKSAGSGTDYMPPYITVYAWYRTA